jgi:hypothetical protein
MHRWYIGCNQVCSSWDYMATMAAAKGMLHNNPNQYTDLLTLRVLMSYIYTECIFLMFLDHIRRRTTVGRTPLDKLIARPEESYRLWCVVVCDLETSRICAPYIYDIRSLRVNDLTLILLTWRKW